MRRWKRNALLAGGGLFAAALGALALCLGLVGPCWSAWWSYGVWVDECPAGVIPYLSVSTSALGRGVKGQITVTAQGQLYDRQLRPIADWEGGVRPLTRFSPRVSIVAAPLEGAVAGTTPPETTLEPERGWDEQWEGTQSGSFFLPKELADGDWILRVTADVPSGSVSLDVPLPLYRPALEHILTDAPIYRPGQTVRARAALLDAGTLKPLESRPGRWRVYDPTGELLLDERGSTAGFGVAATTFPLAPDAPTGMWSIAFESGSSVERQSFDVREYRLPRFTVELTPSEPWYAEGASPVAKGRARYASGAPVQNAPVRVELRAADIAGWPPPNDWLAPQSLTTDADGGFEVRLPRVPEDLVGRPTVLVYATVTDQAGESAAGQAGLLLSEDAIAVDAVTELEGGLVADANNRLFVRVTTPDGRPLPEAKIHLRREWDARDPGLDGATDASAVARFQLDPGSPVTVTEPALPLRPAVPAEPVVISGATDAMAGGTDVRLAELGDRLAAAWRPCARLTDGSIAGSVWLRASSSGVSELWA